jgi:hypothetical protein
MILDSTRTLVLESMQARLKTLPVIRDGGRCLVVRQPIKDRSEGLVSSLASSILAVPAIPITPIGVICRIKFTTFLPW